MKQIKSIARRIPIIRWVYRKYAESKFTDSKEYWESRYVKGGNSGAGSYGRLAEFKAEVIQRIVQENKIQSIIEFGSGDGSQLALAEYESYVGLDVSRNAIRNCIERFNDDRTKSFFLYEPELFKDNAKVFTADMTISLDVIYHLVEDTTFHQYMTHLFAASQQTVLIYSSNSEMDSLVPHVRHRKFTDWIEDHANDWVLTKKIDNRYPFTATDPEGTSHADFYLFGQRSKSPKAL